MALNLLLYRDEQFPTEISGSIPRKRVLLSKMWASMLMFTNSWKESAECMVEVQPLKFGRNWFNFKLQRPLYMILGGKISSPSKKISSPSFFDLQYSLYWGRFHLCLFTSKFRKAGHTCASLQCPPRPLNFCRKPTVKSLQPVVFYTGVAYTSRKEQTMPQTAEFSSACEKSKWFID